MGGEKAMSNIIHLKTKPPDAQSQGILLKSFQPRGEMQEEKTFELEKEFLSFAKERERIESENTKRKLGIQEIVI